MLLLLITSSWHSLIAQETRVDSSLHYNNFNPLIKLQNKLSEFEIYRELNYMRINPGRNDDPNTIWMWTKLSLTAGEKPAYPGESPGSMLEPLHQIFIENSKLNPIRYVLGMAQTAAVGYLAYRHLKKYGLFK